MVSSRNADQSTHVDTPKTSSVSVQLNFLHDFYESFGTSMGWDSKTDWVSCFVLRYV